MTTDRTNKFLAAMLLFFFSAPVQANALDAPQSVGFKVLTAEDGAMDATNMAVIEFDGPIVSPMAENLRAIWQALKADRRFERIVLRLNSPGGIDLEGQKAIEVLADIRQSAALVTLVGENDLCASMCVALYVQGERRYASPASSWVFHGATRSIGGFPSLPLTMAYFDLFRTREIDSRFINFLFEGNYVTTPGSYWMSGAELAKESNIITDLLPNWRPADSQPSQSSGLIRGGI